MYMAPSICRRLYRGKACCFVHDEEKLLRENKSRLFQRKNVFNFQISIKLSLLINHLDKVI